MNYLMRLAGVIAIFALLVACGSGVFEQPYKTPPQLQTVTITVVWVSGDDIRKKCHNENAYACATVGSVASPYSTIYAIKPRSFTEAPLVEALGHELMHALGATH